MDGGLTLIRPAITVQDEGSDVVTNPADVNFTGAGVTVSDDGSGGVVVNVPGGTGGIAVKEGGSAVVATAAGINFDTTDFNVTDEGSSIAGVALAYGTSAGTPAEGNHGHVLSDLTVPSTDVSMNSHKITSLAAPTAASDAATKAYADAIATGLNVKASCRVATTVAGTLATSFENGDTVDGVVLATGDRILIKDQASASANGIYIVAASGSPTRATDADADAEVTSGMFTFITSGTANAGTGWILITANPITVGSTSLSFTQFSGSGALVAGGGLTLSGSTLAVGAGTGITVNADDIAVTANTTNQKVGISKAGAAVTGTRKQINFIEGSGVTLTVADNSGSDRVDVTVAAPTGSLPTLGADNTFLRSNGASAVYEAIRMGAYFVAASNTPADLKTLADAAWICDGTNDDVEIMAAINQSAADSVHRPIVLLPGTYNARTGQIIIPDGLQNSLSFGGLPGMRIPTFVTLSGSTDAFKMDGTATPQSSSRRGYWYIHDLYWKGADTASSVGFNLNNCYDGAMVNVNIEDFATGIKLEAHDLVSGALCYYNRLRDVTVHSCTTGVSVGKQANSNYLQGCKITSNTTGISILRPTDDNSGLTNNVSVTDCAIESNTTGISTEGYGCHFIGNRFENTTDMVFAPAGAGLCGSQNVVISYMSSALASAYPATGHWQDKSVNQDNIIMVPGVLRLGGTGISGLISMMMSRNWAPDGTVPVAQFDDKYTSSGTALNIRGRQGRLGKGISLQRSADWSTFKEYLYAGVNTSSGNAEIGMGAYDTDAITFFTRTGASELTIAPATIITGNVGFYGHATAAKPTVTGSRGSNAALASLLTALAGLGLLTDSSS